MSAVATTTLGIDIGGSSVKAALLRPGVEPVTARGPAYSRPDAAMLADAIRQAVEQLPSEREAAYVGLCLPGVLDEATGAVVAAVNAPGLVGLRPADLLASAGIAVSPAEVRVCTDAFAAGLDVVLARGLTGRTLAISLGTGVGGAVLDRAGVSELPRPLIVSGRGPGHIGQIDCTVPEPDGADPPIGPDGGRGGLEAYIGLPALLRRLGPAAAERLGELRADAPPLSALVRAVRIAHALYRPDHIVLLGGVGLRLKLHGAALQAAIDDGLTALARPGWTLTFGDHEFHAACGCAGWACADWR